ncbi:MAG: hypothetical protein IV090_07940 [Candidatus Sericytochromatia bacterium]|nr:hypothetical protein [Candidatus Sericytochromatia bacterium]
MNKSMYFSIIIKDTSSVSKGMAIWIQSSKDELPGDKIKELTKASRELSLIEGEQLQTEVLVASPTSLDIRPISEYLWGDGTLNSSRLIRHLQDYKSGKRPHHFLPRVGITIVMEEEFIGRKSVLSELEAHIKAHKSCHLRAPRRYGKSSLLGILSTKSDNIVMLELSDMSTLSGFFKTLLRACMRHTKAQDILLETKIFQSWPTESSPSNFSQIFNKAFDDLEKKHQHQLFKIILETMDILAENGLVLFIDEFSLFLRDLHEHDQEQLIVFLQEFHRLRTKKSTPLVTVFSGSAGLSTYMELYGMKELFDDLMTVDVSPISASEAYLLAEELFYGMQKRPIPNAIERLVEFTGMEETIPYFVQALASYTCEQAGLRKEITTEDVEEAYYNRLLGPAGNVCFRDFILRERTYPKEYRLSASNILKHLSKMAPAIVTEEDLQKLCKGGCELKKLMTCLEEDYDIVPEGSGWRMRSKVIADRWRLGEPWLTTGGK